MGSIGWRRFPFMSVFRAVESVFVWFFVTFSKVWRLVIGFLVRIGEVLFDQSIRIHVGSLHRQLYLIQFNSPLRLYSPFDIPEIFR